MTNARGEIIMFHKISLFILSIGILFAVNIQANESLLFPDTSLFETEELTPAMPMIVCDNPLFQFPRKVEGTIVTHTFNIKNDGDAVLTILNVKAGCGCSTTHYDNAILPGKTGVIVLKIDTDGYGGKTYTDIIHVISNDPNTPDLELKAVGPIDSLATVSPKGVSFKGKCSDTHETIVTITPNQDYEFEITGFDLGKLKGKIDCVLKNHSKYYQLVVRNQMKTPGKYWGKIVLNTNHQQKKHFDVWVSAMLKN